jgi:hypothetical protein
MTEQVTGPVQFADSVSPQLIPASEFTHVAAYADGHYTWLAAELRRFPAHIQIAVEPGQPWQASEARVLDVERFDATPADVLPFINRRHQLGHNDATIYCSLSVVPSVIAAIGRSTLPWRLWAAWWWRKDVPPSRDQVLLELFRLTGVALAPSRLWACQWRNGADWDTSVLYGADDFTRRPA